MEIEFNHLVSDSTSPTYSETPIKALGPDTWWSFPIVEHMGVLEGDTPRLHGEREQKVLPDLAMGPLHLAGPDLHPL